MPASYALLCAFIGQYKGQVGGNAVKNWLSGIKAWHDVNGAPWYGHHRWVELARVSARKEGASHKRPLRAPVLIAHLKALREDLDLSKPRDAAVWAVASVTFWGCRRLGETVVAKVSDFDAAYHVTRGVKYVLLLLVKSEI